MLIATAVVVGIRAVCICAIDLGHIVLVEVPCWACKAAALASLDTTFVQVCIVACHGLAMDVRCMVSMHKVRRTQVIVAGLCHLTASYFVIGLCACGVLAI